MPQTHKLNSFDANLAELFTVLVKHSNGFSQVEICTNQLYRIGIRCVETE